MLDENNTNTVITGGPSPYHRDEAPFGHSHCPNCGDAFPPEFLFPIKVGKIVQVVWKQNKQEKQAAKDLSKHSPRELLQNIQRQHYNDQQQLLQHQQQQNSKDSNNNNTSNNLNGTSSGDTNNNNTSSAAQQQQQQQNLDSLLASADDNLAALVPSTLYNIKSPDWTDLPPCISRYRLSLFQLRLNNKMMEKLTSLCENCFANFFPGEDPTTFGTMDNNNRQNNNNSPNRGFLNTTSSSGFGMTSPSNNNNQQKRSPMKPAITFEDFLAQSRFPDRAKDFAFSDVGRAMRHAAAEAKAKQDIRNSLWSHIDKAQEMITTATTTGGSSGGGGGNSFLSPGSTHNNNDDYYGGGGVTWMNENFGGGGGGRGSIQTNNTSTSRQGSILNNHNQENNMLVPTSPNSRNQQQHRQIRFLLGNQTSLASMIEKHAVDTSSLSIIDVPYGDWLQRELWDELTKIMEFGKDVSTTLQNDTNNNTNCLPEDVPHDHQFFELYSRNRLRLPTPSCRVESSALIVSSFDAMRVNRWRPKPGSNNNNNNKKRAVSAPLSSTTTTSSSENNSNAKNNSGTKSLSSLAASLLPSRIDQSFFKDQQTARDLTIPSNLNDNERKCLIEILSGLSLSDSATCTKDFNDNKKLLKINGMKRSYQVLSTISNTNSSNNGAQQQQQNINNETTNTNSLADIATSSSGGSVGQQQQQQGNFSSTTNAFQLSTTSAWKDNHTNNSSSANNNNTKNGMWDTYRFGGDGNNNNNNSGGPNHTNKNNSNQDLPSAIEDFLEQP